MNAWTTTKLTGKTVRVLSAELPTGETFTAQIVSISGGKLVSACFWISGTQVFLHAGQSIRSYQAQAERELAGKLGTLTARPTDLETLLSR